ncbi:MAG TPA: hypothetical protein VK828_18035 [Terriglobales bacterium]|jgi:hypothetical protein|nr:hypothetical protein [Terriglobales bacterium]
MSPVKMQTPQTPTSSERLFQGRSQIRVRARFVLIVAALMSLMVVLHSPAAAEQTQYTSIQNDSSPALVVGFVGGFVHSDDLRHSEVQITRQIHAIYGDRVRVLIYENRRSAEARRMILNWLKREANDSPITPETSADREARSARIILFGHSWGASAVVALARSLQRDGVPVSLTIQVDSIEKNGDDDSLIPANVVEAVNFYQTGGILHGRTKIKAADPSRTKILGNFRFTYEKEPAECRAYPWYDRLLFKGHTAIECDPHVWSQVEELIRTRLPAMAQPGLSGMTARVGG